MTWGEECFYFYCSQSWTIICRNGHRDFFFLLSHIKIFNNKNYSSTLFVFEVFFIWHKNKSLYGNGNIWSEIFFSEWVSFNVFWEVDVGIFSKSEPAMFR
jgi:hypothetical protein